MLRCPQRVVLTRRYHPIRRHVTLVDKVSFVLVDRELKEYTISGGHAPFVLCTKKGGEMQRVGVSIAKRSATYLDPGRPLLESLGQRSACQTDDDKGWR
jgi:hypothetical protein